MDGWAALFFDAVDDAVFIHDHDGNILDANAAACRRLGYTRAEMLALNTRQIDDPDFAVGFAERLEQQFQAGNHRCEGRHRTKDGRFIPVDVNTSVIEFRGQTAVLAVMRDISDRHAIEKALRDSEAMYHSLVECLPQNILRKDCAGRFTFGNQRYCNSLNVAPAQLLGKTDFDFFPAELARKYVEDDRKVIASGRTFETEEVHRLPDGTRMVVHTVKTPVRDAQGIIIGTQCIFWDVTEQHLAVEAVEKSERRYRNLIESSHDGIVVANHEGRITLFNSAAERMFGYPAVEVLGAELTLLMPGEFQSAHDSGFQRYLRTRQARIMGNAIEVRGRHKDGAEFPLEMVLSVFETDDDSQAGSLQFLGTFRDLTERNKIRAALVQNEKLASIGLLSAGVAHEINNPLAFVANNLVVLERELKGVMSLIEFFDKNRAALASCNIDLAKQAQQLGDEVDLEYMRDNLPRLLSRTREGVDRVTRTVHSLRGLARTDSPKRTETYLPDLVENCIEILRGRLKKSNINIVVEHDADPRVPCVSTQINQVLLNLLVNAVQAVEARPGAGNIRVSTQRRETEMLIEISDDGCGISEEHLPKLFDPFFTTKGVGEGTGLGLTITHNIVQAHGGRIDIDSTRGKGTRFRVALPFGTGRP